MAGKTLNPRITLTAIASRCGSIWGTCPGAWRVCTGHGPPLAITANWTSQMVRRSGSLSPAGFCRWAWASPHLLPLAPLFPPACNNTSQTHRPLLDRPHIHCQSFLVLHQSRFLFRNLTFVFSNCLTTAHQASSRLFGYHSAYSSLLRRLTLVNSQGQGVFG